MTLAEIIMEHYASVISTLILALLTWNFKITLTTSQVVKLHDQRMNFISEALKELKERVLSIEESKFPKDQASQLFRRVEKLEDKTV